MGKKEKVLTWVLAVGLFFAVAYLRVGIYSSIFSSFNLDFSIRYSLLFLILSLLVLPSIYFLLKKFTDFKIIKNAFLINSIILPAYFFAEFLAEKLAVPSSIFPRSLECPSISAISQGLECWFPYILLGALLIVLIAFIAVFYHKIKKSKNKYFVNSLAIVLAILFFVECIGLLNGIYSSPLQWASDQLSYKCHAETSQTWTPQYREKIKEDFSEEVEEELKWLSERESFGPILDPEYEKFKLMERNLGHRFREQYWKCFFTGKEKLNFPNKSFVSGLLFFPISIVCLFFSRRVFRRKGFANPVLEKGFLITAVPLWIWGIDGLFYEISTGLIGYLLLFVALSILVPVLYWLGWLPKKSKKKH